jgi:hypothetical protein
VSIAGIVCQYYGVLCSSGSFSPYYAQVYLSAIDFVSISIALYGLIVFYGLTKEELAGKRPLAKFLAIKLIVMFTFYQSFVVRFYLYSSSGLNLTINSVQRFGGTRYSRDRILDDNEYCRRSECVGHMY